MRITRSTLRRLIAEESARLLREAAFPEEIEAVYGEAPPEEDGFEDEDDYTYGDDPEEFMDLPAGEIQRRMRDLDEADKGPSPLAAAEGRLRAAVKDIHPGKVTSLTNRILDLIDDVIMEEAIAAEADGTDEFPFNASVKVLEQMGDTFPEDADFEELHAAIDAVIKPQWRGALESAAEAEADRRDVEDTERDLSHPSRFLEEGDDDSEGEDQDDAFMDDLDREAGMADYRHAHSMGGRSDEEGFAIDYDTGRPNRFTKMGVKGFGRPARVRGADIDSGYDDADDMGDNLAEGEGDSDGPDQYDPDDAEFHADNERQYQNARRFWSGEPGSTLKASHSDFDDVRGSAGDVRPFITRGRQGKPHRVSDDGLSIDSGDEDLNESRWAKLAGILKG